MPQKCKANRVIKPIVKKERERQERREREEAREEFVILHRQAMEYQHSQFMRLIQARKQQIYENPDQNMGNVQIYKRQVANLENVLADLENENALFEMPVV